MIIKKYVVATILSTSFFAASTEIPPQQPQQQPKLTEQPAKEVVVDPVQQKEIEKIFVFPCEPWPYCY
ncbi:MAG: hypothetical protein HRT35_16755 [Algicola sp.]|nr:hypothetical protein [Algicola sp.]